MSGISAFSRRVDSGCKWWNWKTKPSLRFRRSASALWSRSDVSNPSGVMRPEGGVRLTRPSF